MANEKEMQGPSEKKVGMVTPKNVNYAEIINPLNANLPPTNYGQDSKGGSSVSKKYMEDAVSMHNETFVVEGGMCKCNKGTKYAQIKATNGTSTVFGSKLALTLSCTEMIDEDVFGSCKLLTEIEQLKKYGGHLFTVPPVPCKGNYDPSPKKWKEAVSSVNDNGENTISIRSTLRCSQGGKISITRNGQGGQFDKVKATNEGMFLLAWYAMPFADSSYRLLTGRNWEDWSQLTAPQTFEEAGWFLVDLIPMRRGFKLLARGEDILKGSYKSGAKVGEEVVEEAIRASSVEYGEHIGKNGNKKFLKPNVEYMDGNGYKYTTDDFGRIINTSGELNLGQGSRNSYAQRTVGGADRLPTDDGGHLIASQFNGSGQIDNLVPQNSSINRAGGEWYKMEKSWSDALKSGSKVEVNIKPNYNLESVRPDSFNVEYWIDGEKFVKFIKNP